MQRNVAKHSNAGKALQNALGRSWQLTGFVRRLAVEKTRPKGQGRIAPLRQVAKQDTKVDAVTSIYTLRLEPAAQACLVGPGRQLDSDEDFRPLPRWVESDRHSIRSLGVAVHSAKKPRSVSGVARPWFPSAKEHVEAKNNVKFLQAPTLAACTGPCTVSSSSPDPELDPPGCGRVD